MTVTLDFRAVGVHFPVLWCTRFLIGVFVALTVGVLYMSGFCYGVAMALLWRCYGVAMAFCLWRCYATNPANTRIFWIIPRTVPPVSPFMPCDFSSVARDFCQSGLFRSAVNVMPGFSIRSNVAEFVSAS